MSTEIINNDIDNRVDQELISCLDASGLKSFFVFAGAGSGKTGSLVKLLTHIKTDKGYRMRIGHHRVAVITYTNAACNEIKHRLNYDPLFVVKTIHSFIWEVIQTFQTDIREWLRVNLKMEIAKLEEEQAKGRASKASADRAIKIQLKQERVDTLEDIRKFNYNPNGDNKTVDALSHSEVISMGASFMATESVMQDILTHKFPILLIDESQDTKEELIDALFEVQKKNAGHFLLGLFGDTMQRIYNDGKQDLEKVLPADWAKPKKQMNHRSAKRIIRLINNIRSKADGIQQLPRTESDEGFARIYLVDVKRTDKTAIEQEVKDSMATITADASWSGATEKIKVLTLEHHMAASRMGFSTVYTSLHSEESLRTGLLDGTLSGLRFFTEIIAPLIEAHQVGDAFSVAAIVKRYSPFFKYAIIKSQSDQRAIVAKTDAAVDGLVKLWDNHHNPTLLDILVNVAQSELFDIPATFQVITKRSEEEQKKVSLANQAGEVEEDADKMIDAWDKALAAPFSEIVYYKEYLSAEAKFGTHQGVKGLEFERVMVILDDVEARGFLFSYGKLFGTTELSTQDLKNQKEGKETSVDRTLRLFYVACSRAKKSLAIVVYSSDPALAQTNILANNWFSADEIVLL